VLIYVKIGGIILRYLTSGESHGKKLITIIEGVPSNMPLLKEDIDESLLRRQKEHGRGRRMQNKKDIGVNTSGVILGYTLRTTIELVVNHDDLKNREDNMREDTNNEDAKIRRHVSRLRPRHDYLNGAIKYGHRDMRNVL